MSSRELGTIELTREIICAILLPLIVDNGIYYSVRIGKFETAYEQGVVVPEPTLPVWKRISHKTVYKGRVHIVEHDAVLPNGELTKYEVEHGNTCSVAVLIETLQHEIILAHQFRFPLDRWIYDLPGGAKQTGETIEQAAIRECREEVGISPKKLHKLHTFYPNPARTDWPAHVFYCNDYDEAISVVNDPSENVKKVCLPIEDFKQLVDNQEIVDPGLLIAWYAAREKGFIGT